MKDRIAILALGVLATIAMAWTASVSGAQEAANAAQVETRAALRNSEENIRNIHHEQKINRDLLRRIDKNTGGHGDAPDVRPLQAATD